MYSSYIFIICLTLQIFNFNNLLTKQSTCYVPIKNVLNKKDKQFDKINKKFNF